jgi:hypothetical protein
MLKRINGVWLPLIVIIALQAGCHSKSSDGVSLLVTVKGPSGNMQNTTVVLGDSNGAMITYGTTDANGQIAFADPPANATVTAAKSCLSSGATSTTNPIVVKFDVNEPVVLILSDCAASPASPAASGAAALPVSSLLGTVTVNVSSSLSGIAKNELFFVTPGLWSPREVITSQTLTITSAELQGDGTLSVVVIGKDAAGKSLGYGALLAQTFTDGMTMNISVDQPMSFVQYELLNIPTTADLLCAGIHNSITGTDGMWSDDCNSLSSAPSSTSINVPYIPGLGDRFEYIADVFFSRNNGSNGYSESRKYLLIGGPATTTPSNQSFDFSRAPSAPLNLTVSAEETAMPTLAWSGIDPSSAKVSVFAVIRSASSRFYISADLPPAKTSITFPELPDSLAAFRPSIIDEFDVDIIDDGSGMYLWSSGSYYTTRTYPAGAPALDRPAARVLQALKRRAAMQ